MCLFICLVISVVYFEMVFGLDIDLFLNVFYRMVNWRGLFREMLLDNGINVVGFGDVVLVILINILEGIGFLEKLLKFIRENMVM